MVSNINEAISIVQGNYIAHINSDDIWELSKLEKQIDYINSNKEYGAVFSYSSTIDKDNKIIKKDIFFNKTKEKERLALLRDFFFGGNNLCFTTALIKKEVFVKIGLYNSSYLVLLDFDMWVRVCIGGYQIGIIEENLNNFRVADNLSSIHKEVEKMEMSLLIENYKYLSSNDIKKVFPELKNNKNPIDENLLAKFVIDKYLYLANKVAFTNKEKKEFKGIKLIKNSFLQVYILQLLKKENDFKFLKEKFNINYKDYTQIMSDEIVDIKLSNKKRDRKYFIIALLLIIIASLL
jgi:hypothetical protein